MRLSVILAASLLTILPAWARTDAERLCDDLERRLQSLKSLEILYEADAGNAAGESVPGRMVWLRPNHFYHDTPEWTLCETESEQWRHLKESQTLIRERASEDGRWSLESMLFNLRDEFRPTALDDLGDGGRALSLEARDSDMAGTAVLTFASGEVVPSALEFLTADGSVSYYRVVEWRENPDVGESLFDPPSVPAENVLDFRATGVR